MNKGDFTTDHRDKLRGYKQEPQRQRTEIKNRGAITKEHGDEEQWQRDAQEW